jgi:hypothetical protein
VYSKYIRFKYATDGIVQCVTCGVRKPVSQMQCGHFISRGKYSTRWHEDNTWPQCVICNMFKHGNYPKYSEFLIKTFGASKIEELNTLGDTILKISTADIEAMIEHYKSELSKLQKLT